LGLKSFFSLFKLIFATKSLTIIKIIIVIRALINLLVLWLESLRHLLEVIRVIYKNLILGIIKGTRIKI
jgi:hypothetical protein